ncbi:hypothetical protein Hanom_Chr13g01245341 [Helianthus anomalus]
MKMTRFQTFWIQMRKNKPLDESRNTGQTLGTKITFYSFFFKLTSNSRGGVRGPYLWITFPSLFTKNLVKFHFMPSTKKPPFSDFKNL